MSEVIFNESDHSYKGRGFKYTSVSKLVGRFKQPFRQYHWAGYKALERILGKKDFKEMRQGFDPKDSKLIKHCLKFVDNTAFEVEKQLILDEWKAGNKKAVKRGNKYHKVRERVSLEKGIELNPFDNQEYKVFVKEELENADNYAITNNLYELEDGYYPELLMWNNKYRIAGQADRVFIETVGGKKLIDVDDYKTNKKIKTDNFFANMKAPLDTLPDCNYIHYNLQISCYAWLLEQFGFTVRNLAFHHFNKKYELPYRKSEIESMLKLHYEDIKNNQADG